MNDEFLPEVVPVGVEIKETEVSDEDFEEMKGFVRDYLAASVESEEDGGRMRWYPWHSSDYRFNHILNVVDLATDIAEAEGADVDVVRVAAVFHDVAKLEAEQDVHAEAGARVAREYLQSRGNYPESFIEEVCGAVVDHSYTGDLTDVPLGEPVSDGSRPARQGRRERRGVNVTPDGLRVTDAHGLREDGRSGAPARQRPHRTRRLRHRRGHRSPAHQAREVAPSGSKRKCREWTPTASPIADSADLVNPRPAHPSGSTFGSTDSRYRRIPFRVPSIHSRSVVVAHRNIPPVASVWSVDATSAGESDRHRATALRPRPALRTAPLPNLGRRLTDRAFEKRAEHPVAAVEVVAVGVVGRGLRAELDDNGHEPAVGAMFAGDRIGVGRRRDVGVESFLRRQVERTVRGDGLLKTVEQELEQVDQQLVFSVIVVIDERGTLVELLADPFDREIRVPVLAERAERRSEDGLTGVGRLRERVLSCETYRSRVYSVPD